MNKFKQAAVASRKFVADHRVGVAVTLTSIAWFGLVRSNVKQYNAFLETKGLLEEYWTIEEE